MATNKVNGEVWTDGQLCYSGIYPSINDKGFNLSRRNNIEPQQCSHIGPHIDLRLPTPSLIQAVPRTELCETVKYQFSGPHLGNISELGGYPAADAGSRTREVKKIELEVILKDKILILMISGVAGPILPWSANGNLGNNSSESLVLKILCPIPIFEISTVVEGHSGFFLQKHLECETFQEYVEAIKCGPPQI